LKYNLRIQSSETLTSYHYAFYSHWVDVW